MDRRIVDLPAPGRLRIVFVGDLQAGAPGWSRDALRAELQRHASCGLPLYFVGTGDYIDIASPGNRRKLAGARLYDSVQNAIYGEALRRLEEVLGVLGPTKGRWLACVRGHHYFEYQGFDSDRALGEALGVEVTSSPTLLVLRFVWGTRTEASKSRDRALALQLMVFHGYGNGVAPASGLNRLQRLARAFPTVDVIVMGHQHKACAYTDEVVEFTLKGDVYEHRRFRHYIMTAGFVKSYGPETTYVEPMMLPPLPARLAALDVEATWKGKNRIFRLTPLV